MLGIDVERHKNAVKKQLEANGFKLWEPLSPEKIDQYVEEEKKFLDEVKQHFSQLPLQLHESKYFLFGQMRIEVPVATDGGKPISGVVHSKFILDAAAPQFNVTDLAAYTPSDPAGPDTRLTVRMPPWTRRVARFPGRGGS